MSDDAVDSLLEHLEERKQARTENRKARKMREKLKTSRRFHRKARLPYVTSDAYFWHRRIAREMFGADRKEVVQAYLKYC